MMSDPKRKVPLSEMGAFIRSHHQLPAAVCELIEATRERHEGQREAVRATVRDINDGIAKLMASSLQIDPRAFVALPADLGNTASTMELWNALKEVPGAKISVTYTSEVTINGVRVPDEDQL
jgi:hypothetical protein